MSRTKQEFEKTLYFLRKRKCPYEYQKQCLHMKFSSRYECAFISIISSIKKIRTSLCIFTTTKHNKSIILYRFENLIMYSSVLISISIIFKRPFQVANSAAMIVGHCIWDMNCKIVLSRITPDVFKSTGTVALSLPYSSSPLVSLTNVPCPL